jgi:hypothetical protein
MLQPGRKKSAWPLLTWSHTAEWPNSMAPSGPCPRDRIWQSGREKRGPD